MSLNESTVENAALMLPAATLTPPLPLLSGELRMAAVTAIVEASA